jgi:membrane dipeptidase
VQFFDAHLDLACLAENGRDMTLPPEEAGGPWAPGAVTFPSLREGRVEAFLGTIFTEADGDDAVAYPAGDAQAAHDRGLRQLERYEQWDRGGILRLTRRGSGPASPPSRAPAPACLLLMECADPIRTPDELDWWASRGIACIGMAWARGSRYASGNGEPGCSSGVGLTGPGRALAAEMDRLGILHDASHLSDRALADLFSLTDRPIIASHSNCRALLGGTSQRHLADPAIREIARRGGIIGLNLCANFIRPGLQRGDRPTIDQAIAHVEHICQIAGHRRAVGLGSDMDGGFSSIHLPRGIDRPRDLPRLAEALAARGWPDQDIRGFCWENWARFWLSARSISSRCEGGARRSESRR